MKVNINHKTHLCSPLQKNPDRDFKQESIIQINTRHVLCLLNIWFKDIWQSRFYMYSMIWCTLGFFLCLFVWGFSSNSRIFHSCGDVTIAGEGLHILTYARYLWPMSSDGSLACHTFSNTGYPFIMIISEDP